MRAVWASLPREEKALFNPAFLALLLARASQGYEDELKVPIPIPLSFISLAVALHGPTRAVLPRSVATNMVRWVQDHPEVRAMAPNRIMALIPLLREGLLFALTRGVCSLTDDAGLVRSPQLSLPAPRGRTDDVAQCHRAAVFMGRWSARAGSPETVLALFGVRP